MWTLTNTSLPTKAITFHNSPVVSVLKPATELTGSGLIATLLDQSLVEITVVEPGTIPDTYIIQLQEGGITPSVITTPEQTFSPAKDITNPQSGEFITIEDTVIIFSNVVLTVVTYISAPPVNSLFIPQISGLEGLPILSNITINENFQDQPTASIQLVTSNRFINAIRSRFRNGSLFRLGKYDFIVNSYSEDLNTTDDTLACSISLRGKWDLYVNYPIPLNNTTGLLSNNFTDPECEIGYVKPTSKDYITINEIANKVGASISGINFSIKISDKKDRNLTTTINSALGEYLDINGSFVDYSKRNAITIKKLNNVATWNYVDGNIISNFNTSINRLPPLAVNGSYGTLSNSINYGGLVPSTITNRGNYFSNEDTSIIPTPTIYNFSTPDNFNNNGIVIEEEAARFIPPKFKAREPVIERYTTGDEQPLIPPDTITKIETLDFNFDRSGVTKTSIFKVTEDGFPVTEIVRKYGFAYTAWDITSYKTIAGESVPYLFTSNPGHHWTLIEETSKNYVYDDDTGYLLGYTLNGRKLLRVAVEGDDLYTQQYQLNIGDEEPDPFDIAKYNTYLWKYVPIDAAKSYLLVQHKEYYKQFDSEEEYIKRCNKDGTSSYIPNPNFVHSMFSLAEGEEYAAYRIVGNPENLLREADEPEKPPLTTGQETYNRNVLKILPSKNTRSDIGSPLGIDKAKGEDKYLTYTSTFTAQDPGFNAVSESTDDSESSGMPPVHTRKPPKYELIEPDKEELEKNDEARFRYIFYTQPYTGGYPRTGSYNFTKAKDIREVRRAVLNQLTIDDIRGTLTSSMTVPYNSSIKTGDRVNIAVNGLVCRRRVVGITHNIVQDIDDKNRVITTATTTLQMGIDRVINISDKKERIPKPNTTGNNRQFTLIDNTTFRLGSLLQSNLPRRGR